MSWYTHPDAERAVLALVAEGRPMEYVTRGGQRKTVRIDRRYSVTLDGQVIGYVEYRMATRETKSEGRRYVNSRWSSPGWYACRTEFGRGYESPDYTRQGAVSYLIRQMGRPA